MPGLLRGMARTAVIAGTATAASNAVNRRQAEKNAASYARAEQQYYESQAPPPSGYAGGGAAGGATSGSDDAIARLERLAQLRAQGVLTEEEFAAEKRKILG